MAKKLDPVRNYRINGVNEINYYEENKKPNF